MIIVPMTEDGPDMDIVEHLVKDDPSIKGIWCVPLYSNPQGVVYSDETVRRLAFMETAATDFRIFWDNAYGVHHVFEEHMVANILDLAREAGKEDRVYYFFSTSKINFPGAGVGLVAAGPDTVKRMLAHLKMETIGFDKVTQLRTVKFFEGNAENVRAHMTKIADLLRPRFDLVLETLSREFEGTGILEWTAPKGGYFVSVDTLDGCAGAVVARAKEAGVTLTPAGATWPYGKDPRDRNIRIAPTYPGVDELARTLELFAVCVKLVTVEKLLGSAG
jgi:DNA-binding transcriptional MocR family regulator